jgi:hypothetical protein
MGGGRGWGVTEEGKRVRVADKRHKGQGTRVDRANRQELSPRADRE